MPLRDCAAKMRCLQSKPLLASAYAELVKQLGVVFRCLLLYVVQSSPSLPDNPLTAEEVQTLNEIWDDSMWQQVR